MAMLPSIWQLFVARARTFTHLAPLPRVSSGEKRGVSNSDIKRSGRLHARKGLGPWCLPSQSHGRDAFSD
jgi:hypothetical protein